MTTTRYETRGAPNRPGNRNHLRGEVRAVTDEGTFEVLAVAYNIVDDYGTRFIKGVFNDSLEQRLPVIAWAHDWSEPIGRATGWSETDEGLFITGRLDLGGHVERAKQAHEQMRSGTLTDVSVGFWRLADRTADDGVTEIVKGDLDEVSVVLRGAVPGARVLAVRSARTGEQVDLDAVVAIAAKKAAGEIDQATADEALAMLSSGTGTPPVESGGGSGDDAPDLDQVLAEADAALDLVSDRSRR